MRNLSLIGLVAVLSACGNNSYQVSTLSGESVLVDKWHNPEVERLSQDPNIDDEMRSFFKGLEEDCNDEHVHGVTNIPIHHDKADSATFTYYFEADIKNPNEPTIIYLPGGPGGNGIGISGHWTKQNYVNIDHRGINCNFTTDKVFDFDAMTTWQTVRDIGYVIRALDLKDFIIFGHSYGTVSATMLTHHLENDLGIFPRAVVLSGILGYGWENFTAWFHDHFDQWTKLKADYPKAGLLFANGQLPPLGGSRAEWGGYLFNVGNDYEDMGEELSTLYDDLEKFRVNGERSKLMDRLAKNFDGKDPEFVTFPAYTHFTMDRIMCQDLTHYFRWFGSTIAPDGSMQLHRSPGTPENYSICDGIPQRPLYDSKNYQMKSPLVYLQGDTDPQTPLLHALYHFENQRETTRKEFIRSKFVGHGFSWDMKDCIDQIFTNIAQDLPVKPLLTADGLCPNATKETKRKRPYRSQLPLDF